MATEKKVARGARSGEAASAGEESAGKPDDRQPAGGSRWYIRHQGRNFNLVQSNGRPNARPAEGAKTVLVHGPYDSEAVAKMVFERLAAKGNAVESLDLAEGTDAA